LFGCTQLKDIKPTVLATDAPKEIPTATPSPTLPPVYSYFPAISAANATKVVNINDYSGGVNSLAFSPNGKYLAATFDNGVGIFWDISNARGWQEWVAAPKDVFASNGQVSFSRDSSILATGGTLLQFPSKRLFQEMQAAVVFNPINETLAIFDWNNISIQKLGENQPVLKLKEGTAGITNVTFSPDGNLLGEAINEDVNIWRVSDHTLLHSFPPIEHNHPAHFNFFAYSFLAFSPDNHFVATGARDLGVVRIWNLQTGELVKDISTAVQMQEGGIYAPNVGCVIFSRDSKIIAIAGGNTIIFKRIPDGEFITMLGTSTYQSKYITTCAASNDGKLLATGDSGGGVNVWGVPAYAP
jgi:WD40 repeat protein